MKKAAFIFSQLVLLLLLVVATSGAVSAKVASGPQEFAGGLHQGGVDLEPPWHLGSEVFSTIEAPGSSLVTKSGASRLADKAQSLPGKQRPNTVAVIKHKDGTVTVGRNQGGVQNSTVQNALNNAPQNCFAGQCAEVNTLSRALNKGRSLDGATISVSNVRGAGSTSGIHGTPKAPCTTCSSVLDQLGVKLSD